MAWNRPQVDSRAKDSPRRTGTVRPAVAVRWLIAGVLVVAGIFAVWVFLGGETSSPTTKKRARAKIPDAAKVIHNKQVAKDAVSETRKPITESVKPPANGQTPQFVPPAPPVRTNEASRLRAMNSVHRTGFEQILLNIFSCEPGNMPRPLPSDIPEAEMKRLAEILISKDEIKDSDTENMMLAKDLLAKAKAAMVKFIKDGGEPEEFIVSYHEQLEHAFHERQKAMSFVGQLVREGEDPAVISKYVDKTNEKFAAQGIMEIDKPAVAEEQGDE